MTGIHHYQYEKDQIRGNLNRYTRKAFFLIPAINNPRILDIGCGTGVPTLELAMLSNGEIDALDIDPQALKQLDAKLHQAGWTNRIRIINRSIAAIDFPDDRYDIVWSEGAVYAMGFKAMLKMVLRLLKRHGFLVLHDEKKDKKEKMGLISSSGFRLIGHFGLSEKCWWEEYYVPLERLISRYREEFHDDPQLSKLLDRDQAEIDLCRTGKRSFESFFVIMQKMG